MDYWANMNDQLPIDASSIESLQQRNAELEAKLTELARQNNLMIRSIFHDIKNPLAVSLGSLQVCKLVAGKELSPKALHLLQSAEEGSAQQLAMIHNLADQIKIEMGELTFQPEAVNANDLIRQQIENISNRETNRKFLLEEIDKNLAIECDRAAFKKALRNILEHSVKHTHRDGIIQCIIDSEEHSGKARISVADNGEALRAEHFEDIFDRTKTTNSKSLGERRDIGMGLSYARIAIQAMGGNLVAVPNNDHGARFVITMPMAH